MFGWIAAAISFAPVVDSATLAQWGREALDQIRANYLVSGQNLYTDRNVLPGQPSQPAFTWGVGVMLSALNAASRWDPKLKPLLREYADGTRVYWNSIGPVPGYDVLPCPKPVDRYYDDNAWMVMALVEASDTLKDRKYLQWAQETLAYVLSGEDDKLGGGIYWRESDKNGKNCCANGPSVAAMLAVYGRTKDAALLDHAEKLYSWTKEHFQDPEDHLFWDGESLSGHVEKYKWSYNTGLMLRSASELARITRKQSYADDASEIASSSVKHWFVPETGALNDEGKFAHLLMDAWTIFKRDLPDQASLLPDLSKPLADLHAVGRTESGFYGGRWGRKDDPKEASFELIDQASAVRALYEVALSERK
ncbi:MAG: glycoside hydrolase family 76 protein [Fimbriimonas sp.]|nr:glycoside hydrolase family 76 protein [Fimbriimonas sp.]